MSNRIELWWKPIFDSCALHKHTPLFFILCGCAFFCIWLSFPFNNSAGINASFVDGIFGTETHSTAKWHWIQKQMAKKTCLFFTIEGKKKKNSNEFITAFFHSIGPGLKLETVKSSLSNLFERKLKSVLSVQCSNPSSQHKII